MVEKVWVVDDDDIYQFTIRLEIERTQLAGEVKAFLNAELAIQELEAAAAEAARLPDLMLVDINMPIMDGWEFLERYRELVPRLCKKTQIYMVSSSVNASDIERAKHLSVVSDYIVKPISRDLLHALLSADIKNAL
ncbi:Response regulator receiver domain-containing protein [Catalinimonas alkaloidigena]|uniref:Response regulator receiver domain-containing protein n=1 Tax=Catalinimonas alkaloidigena TaxID=1075417 RepID=A0A1G9ISR8_9BACT|nr:response regulator [Catalinimonas alkaloidigena]SDL28115.1 Response regulator receiver domain-containing protein [Catalinimonas alkaloidigena]